MMTDLEKEDPKTVVAECAEFMRLPDWTHQVFAAGILGLMRLDAGVPLLASALKSDFASVRLEALAALKRINTREALTALQSPDGQAAAERFRCVLDRDLLLFKAFLYASGFVRLPAQDPSILGIISADESTLIDVLKHGDWKQRILAAQKLGNYASIESVRALGQALEDPDFDVESAAITSLHELSCVAGQCGEEAKLLVPNADVLRQVLSECHVRNRAELCPTRLLEIRRAKRVERLV
jgi:hypothetical protein